LRHDEGARSGGRAFRFKIVYKSFVQKLLPPGPVHHRIEITAAASRSEEPLAAHRTGHSGAVAPHKFFAQQHKLMAKAARLNPRRLGVT